MNTIPYIPYFATSRYRVQTMVELSSPKPGEVMADLGSGDGRIIIEFAKRGVNAHGYEIDSEKIDESRLNSKESNVQSLVTIIDVDFWNVDLSSYDIITIYPMPDVMEALEEKLKKEVKKGTRVLLNYYSFNGRKPKKVKDHIYYYLF